MNNTINNNNNDDETPRETSLAQGKAQNNHQDTNTERNTTMDLEPVKTNLFHHNANSGDPKSEDDDHKKTTKDEMNTTLKIGTNVCPIYIDDTDEEDIADEDSTEYSLVSNNSNDTKKSDLATSKTKKKRTIFDIPIDSSNKQWKEDFTPQYHTSLPFDQEEDYQPNKPNSLKHQLTAIKLMFEDLDDERESYSMDQWYDAIQQLFNVPDEADDEEDTKHLHNAWRTLLRLAMTDPVAFFPSHHWENGQMILDNDMTNAWCVAYCYYKAPWKNRDKWFTQLPTAPPSKSKQVQSTLNFSKNANKKRTSDGTLVQPPPTTPKPRVEFQTPPASILRKPNPNDLKYTPAVDIAPAQAKPAVVNPYSTAAKTKPLPPFPPTKPKSGFFPTVPHSST